MARPRKEIDQKTFESLCGIQCSLAEIAAVFDCSEDTIERWCKRTYKTTFAEVFAQKRGKGKTALRRAMYRNAVEKGNATMQIWLSRNWLGMTERPQEAIDTEDADAYFTEAGMDEKQDAKP